MQQTKVFRGDMAKRTGWGDHSMDAWQLFFDKIYELKQITKPVKAEDAAPTCLSPAPTISSARR
jgi:NitT/TauT family transport system substrate-binding protein